MAKRMLIDASHPEETRVVVLSGNRLEEFDYESASRKPLKGNIYLAKVTRVEPSLQAAFVDYGGNRHGFLPFSEIHPDYYRIPIADREALLAEEASLKSETVEEVAEDEEDEPAPASPAAEAGEPPAPAADGAGKASSAEASGAAAPAASATDGAAANGEVEEVAVETGVDTVGGDEVEDAARKRARLLRRYKIQEVVKRRQVILVQVTKEERGNKGAALTTYLSLAGRYCVLMPNTARGGGISRKISNAPDRRRLKRVLEDLEIPEGVGVIVRTAGSERTKAEIRRDYDYLIRLWSEIRDTTLASTAPSLIYEEANLIKRAMRDLYYSDMDEILVEGEEGYKAAKAFMKSLMPSHARKVKVFKDSTVPLFQRYQVESQIDAMHGATVQLKSGGYIVINMTEALVSIDVNSGRATRERHIEETAYKTNLEAAEEIARQLRLRDLAGLIVIDFIDMEESRHNRGVERRLKEALRNDRARIQLGRISPFGLLEMSRQRLRPSLAESSTTLCPHCSGSGYVRTTESSALHVLRGLEEEGIRRGGGQLSVAAPMAVALHLLNHFRERLVAMESRYELQIHVETDDSLIPPAYRLERLTRTAGAPARPGAEAVEAEEAEAEEADADAAEAGEAEATERPEGERRRGRGRRRRRRDEPSSATAEASAATGTNEATAEEPRDSAAAAADSAGEEAQKRRRRRGKRGGRRRSRRQREEDTTTQTPAAEGETEEPLAAEAVEPSPPPGAADEEAAGVTSEDGRSRPAARPQNRRRRAARRGDAAAVAQPPVPAGPPLERHDGAEGAEDARDKWHEPAPAAPEPRQGDAPASVSNGEDESKLNSPAEEPRRRGWWQRWG